MTTETLTMTLKQFSSFCEGKTIEEIVSNFRVDVMAMERALQ
jgi:hypothetical protein